MQGRRNDIKSGWARFNGLNKVGDKVGILLTRVGYSMIFESFWNTNKWNMVFYVPHSPPNVLNSMSLWNPISIHLISPAVPNWTWFLGCEKWGSGGLPPENFCRPRPSNCRKMITLLVNMLKPNKIPRLKLYIAIIFCLITLLLKHLWEIMKVISSQPKRILVNKKLIKVSRFSSLIFLSKTTT